MVAEQIQGVLRSLSCYALSVCTCKVQAGSQPGPLYGAVVLERLPVRLLPSALALELAPIVAHRDEALQHFNPPSTMAGLCEHLSVHVRCLVADLSGKA
jgi:hypothetical protein